MFCEALDKYGDLSALGFKRQGMWEHISYNQYYLLARKAAKGFLKVREPLKAQPLPSPALPSSSGPHRPLSDVPLGKPLERITVKTSPFIELIVRSGLVLRVYVHWALAMCQDGTRASRFLSHSRGLRSLVHWVEVWAPREGPGRGSKGC